MHVPGRGIYTCLLDVEVNIYLYGECSDILKTKQEGKKEFFYQVAKGNLQFHKESLSS